MTAPPTISGQSEDLFPAERIAPTAALIGADIAVRAAFDRLVNEPTGIDAEMADFIVRLSICPTGGLRGVDLVEQLRVNPTKVSRLADRMEAAGLVERQSDPDDRRAQRLVLSEAGVEVAHRLAPRVDELLGAMIHDEFSIDELSTFIALLDRLRDRAAELADGAG